VFQCDHSYELITTDRFGYKSPMPVFKSVYVSEAQLQVLRIRVLSGLKIFRLLRVQNFRLEDFQASKTVLRVVTFTCCIDCKCSKSTLTTVLKADKCLQGCWTSHKLRSEWCPEPKNYRLKVLFLNLKTILTIRGFIGV